MNFYLWFYQLMAAAERLEEGAWHLAAHALRSVRAAGRPTALSWRNADKGLGMSES
jgi:hypothetical protein